MAECVETRKKWTVRCPCGAVIQYEKKDVFKESSNSVLSNIIQVKLDKIKCPECGQKIQVYFSKYTL